MKNLFRRIPHVNHPAWSAFRADMERRMETVGADRCAALEPSDMESAWYAFRNGWDVAARDLMSSVVEYFAAQDAPAKSPDRGETSVWLARCADAERQLRAVAGIKESMVLAKADAPSLQKVAARLEVEVAILHKQNQFLRAFVDSLKLNGDGCESCATDSIARGCLFKEIS